MSKAEDALIAIVTGFISLAIISVIISSKAQTPSVISAFGSALANVISAATSPVTGNSATPNVGNGTFGASGGSGGGSIFGSSAVSSITNPLGVLGGASGALGSFGL
jgi:hypothetical protein